MLAPVNSRWERGFERPSQLQANGNVIVFNVAAELFAFSTSCVQEIVPMAQLSRPPGLPSILEGFLNLGGTAVPVLRLDRLFGLAAIRPGLYTPLLILQIDNHPIGALVDQVNEVLAVTEEALLPVGGSTFNDCVIAELSGNERTIHLLDPNRILLEQERQALVEFQAIAQRRLGELEAAA